MKPKVDEAYGAYTGGGTKDFNGLSSVWNTIDSSIRDRLVFKGSEFE